VSLGPVLESQTKGEIALTHKMHSTIALRRLTLLTHRLSAWCQLVPLTRAFIPDRRVGRRECQTRPIAQRSKHE
jgi:hypothetical protein